MKMLLLTRCEADFLLSLLRDIKKCEEDNDYEPLFMEDDCMIAIDMLEELQEVEVKIPEHG